jgi:hypothetical protein
MDILSKDTINSKFFSITKYWNRSVSLNIPLYCPNEGEKYKP